MKTFAVLVLLCIAALVPTETHAQSATPVKSESKATSSTVTATATATPLAKANLAVGTKAPAFSLKDEKGNTVSLDQFRGKRDVVLVFYPGDNTPGCTKQLCSVRDDWDKFTAKNIAVFGVNPADSKSHESFIQNFSYPFPLLVDEGGAVSKAYGAWSDRGFVSRTVYGIDKNGMIVFSERGMPADDKILAAFDKTTGAGN